jgi:hypothetical protein
VRTIRWSTRSRPGAAIVALTMAAALAWQPTMPAAAAGEPSPGDVGALAGAPVLQPLVLGAVLPALLQGDADAIALASALADDPSMLDLRSTSRACRNGATPSGPATFETGETPFSDVAFAGVQGISSDKHVLFIDACYSVGAKVLGGYVSLRAYDGPEGANGRLAELLVRSDPDAQTVTPEVTQLIELGGPIDTATNAGLMQSNRSVGLAGAVQMIPYAAFTSSQLLSGGGVNTVLQCGALAPGALNVAVTECVITAGGTVFRAPTAGNPSAITATLPAIFNMPTSALRACVTMEAFFPPQIMDGQTSFQSFRICQTYGGIVPGTLRREPLGSIEPFVGEQLAPPEQDPTG